MEKSHQTFEKMCARCQEKEWDMLTRHIIQQSERSKIMGLVSFDIVKRNPGALTFLMNAYDLDMVAAEKGFKRMEKAGITGSWLYMLWNDCCNRDTKKALKAMNKIDIEVIKDHVFRPRGIPFDELEAQQ